MTAREFFGALDHFTERSLIARGKRRELIDEMKTIKRNHKGEPEELDSKIRSLMPTLQVLESRIDSLEAKRDMIEKMRKQYSP